MLRRPEGHTCTARTGGGEVPAVKLRTKIALCALCMLLAAVSLAAVLANLKVLPL